MLLDLCVIQAENGTAAEAIHYMPMGYVTREAAIGRIAGDTDSARISSSADSGGNAVYHLWVGLWVLSIAVGFWTALG
jgi:hypothetical protein